MPAPLLLLKSADADDSDRPVLTLDQSLLVQGFWTSAEPDGFSHTISILASGNTPGVLQPGESFRVPVYYAGLQPPWDFSDIAVEFELRTFTTDESTPIDWNALKTSMRPPAINADAWEAVFSNLMAQTGTTWGDYVTMLDDNATYLGRLGQIVLDVGQLWSFELQQSNGLSPLAQLAAAIDASVVTPGLPLSFGRIFAQPITARYAMGLLGRGWSTPWEVSLVKDADGSINIFGASGSTRRFQPDSRNSGYFAQARDHGTLTALAGGAFSVREANGFVTAFRADGKLDYVQDTNGNRITAAYTSGKLTSLTHSSGQFLAISYNAAGLIQNITDSANRATTYTYDASNQHLTEVQGYDGRVTRYTYGVGAGVTKEHALLSIEFPGSTHRYFTYDAQGRLASTFRDGEAERATFVYDQAGKVTVTNALGGVGKIFFDQRGLLVKTEDPFGNITTSAFDSAFNLTRVTDTMGQLQTYTYDASGNLTSVTDVLGHTTRFTYSGAFNQLASVTDARNNTMRYSYDAEGNLLSIAYPNNSVEQLTYDPLGTPLTSTNRRGQTIGYTYNSADK